MKTIGLKAFGILGLSLMLSACGLMPNLGSVPQPYQIDVSNLGYTVSTTGILPIPVTVNLIAAPGAPDIYNVKYKATLQTLDGDEAVPGDSVVRGVMFAYARGGYKCTSTPDEQCSINSKDFFYVANQTIAPNNASNSNLIANLALTAGAWASSHVQQGAPANWVVRFEYEGRTSQGNTVKWNSIEQFTSPATPGGVPGSS